MVCSEHEWVAGVLIFLSYFARGADRRPQGGLFLCNQDRTEAVGTNLPRRLTRGWNWDQGARRLISNRRTPVNLCPRGKSDVFSNRQKQRGRSAGVEARQPTNHLGVAVISRLGGGASSPSRTQMVLEEALAGAVGCVLPDRKISALSSTPRTQGYRSLSYPILSYIVTTPHLLTHNSQLTTHNNQPLLNNSIKHSTHLISRYIQWNCWSN